MNRSGHGWVDGDPNLNLPKARPTRVSGEDAVELREILITQCTLFFEQQDAKLVPCEAIMEAIREALDDAKREES